MTATVHAQENTVESAPSVQEFAKRAFTVSHQSHANAPTVGTEVGTYPVSADCKIKLIATGPYDKASIEALVQQLQLNLKLGVFPATNSVEKIA